MSMSSIGERSARSLWSFASAWLGVALAIWLALIVRMHLEPVGQPFVDADSELHMRRAEQVLAEGVRTLGRVDRWLNWPDGVHVAWPPGYDLLLAAVGRLVGPVRFERVAGLLTALLGALTMPVAYAFARTLLPSAWALVATVMLAFLPAHVELSRAGRVDHHVLEALWLWSAFALVWSAHRAQSHGRVRACLAGACLALLVFCVPGAMLGLSLFVAAAACLRSRAAVFALASGAVLTFALALLPFGQPPFSLEEPSFAQPLLLGVSALVIELWSRPAPTWQRALSCAGMLFLFVLLGQQAGIFSFAAKRGLIGTIVESRSLFAFGMWPALVPFSGLVVLFPLASVAVLGTVTKKWRGVSGEKDRDGRVLAALALVAHGLFAATLLQRRFMHLASLPLLVMTLVAAHEISTGPWLRRRKTGMLLALPLLLVAAAVPVARYLNTPPTLHPRLPAVTQLAAKLATLPPGAVLAQWPYGHTIVRRGKRPVVASPLLTRDTLAAAEEATLALLADDALAAWKLMERRTVRYLLATDLPPGTAQRFLDALGDGRDPNAVERNCLLTQLMAGRQIPGFRLIARSSDGKAKLFERTF